MNHNNQILIHIIKTIAYRFTKATAGSAADFGTFKISEDTRSPNEIINHMFDLAAKANSILKDGHSDILTPTPLDFIHEQKRFLDELQALQSVLETREMEMAVCKKILQGPITDMATHIGQLAMLNGLHGNKIPKEHYYHSKIK